MRNTETALYLVSIKLSDGTWETTSFRTAKDARETAGRAKRRGCTVEVRRDDE